MAWACLSVIVPGRAHAQAVVSYGVPEGFSEIELDNTASYVATYDGKTLPGLVNYSQKRAALGFDAELYAANGISVEEINAIRNVVSRIDYKQCVNGCDMQVAGHYVTVDKVRRTLDIRSSRSDYLAPSTSVGLVSSHAIDLRGSSDGYRSANVYGNTWLGLPGRSFGYASWYGGRSRTQGRSTSNQGLSSYYLQKNFSGTYVRAGKQNSIDYASGSVSTVLTPSFDRFVTIGSQDNLRNQRNAGSLVLYATAEGNYEFYRNGRLVWKRPATLGRNEVSYLDLPGGYYPLEIRLVDRNGNVLNSETRDINNLNFASGQNSWHVTVGQEMNTGENLVQASVSRNLSQFYLNGSVVRSQRSEWATEVNLTRPSKFGETDITPTVGVLAGERGKGGYANLQVSDPTLGSLWVSRYLNNDVSRFYWGSPSTSVSYSHLVRGVSLGYNYYKQPFGETHQAEVRWNYRPNGLWSTFALGVQKGGYMSRDGGYAVYFNMTWTLDKTQASFRAAQYGGQTQMSGDYRRDFQDSYGSTSLGTTVTRQDRETSLTAYGSRSGTRGDTSLNLGHNGRSTSADFNYRGMVAASADGLALGRYSGGGSALLLKTPEVSGTDYGFNVEGHPVAGGGTYAVPLGMYDDVSFARVVSGNDGLDMNIEVPANIVRAHPGQVYPAQAKVDINMVYSGLLTGPDGEPVGGRILETGDTAHPNGLFSISAKTVLPKITVQQAGRSYVCDLSDGGSDGRYRCE
jgi:hypothetical protein|nr:TcfC E-set like domain-containing protein [Achromobacter sp. AONIH1]